jgi:hypothetical protein
VAVAVAVTAVSGVVWAQAVAGRLGMTPEDADDNFLQMVVSGGLSYTRTAAQAFMALPPAARATLVRDGFAWARAYSTSPAFKAAYDKMRSDNKPVERTFDNTVDEEAAARRAKQKKEMEESRAALVNLPAADRAQMEAVLTQAEAQMATPQMIAAVRQGIAAERQEAHDDYVTSLATWQKDYPTDPQVLIARRLQRLLNESAGIDFTAKTRVNGRGTEFVDGTFESKPSYWKMGFRAGEPAVTAARTAASDWLKALPKP